MLFTAHLSGSVGYSTVRAYMSAVRHLHLSKGYADPFLAVPQLDLVFKGVKRLKPSGQDRRLPITLSLARYLGGSPESTHRLHKHHDVGCLLPRVLCILHCGEFTVNDPFDPGKHLEISDIALDSYEIPTMISVFLKQSKTDQDKSGIKLFLGRTNQDLCPVVAVLAYLLISCMAEIYSKGRRSGLVLFYGTFVSNWSSEHGGSQRSGRFALGRWKSDAFK